MREGKYVKFRGYRPEEFDFACSLRDLPDTEAIEKFRERFIAVGNWRDHYLDYVIDVDGQAIGELQVRHCDKTMPDGALEFGMGLAPQFQGKGYGTRAIIAITEMMFSQGYHRIAGDTDRNNVAMQQAFEKAGWRFEGTRYALFVEDGTPLDYLMYSRTIFQ